MTVLSFSRLSVYFGYLTSEMTVVWNIFPICCRDTFMTAKPVEAYSDGLRIK